MTVGEVGTQGGVTVEGREVIGAESNSCSGGGESSAGGGSCSGG